MNLKEKLCKDGEIAEVVKDVSRLIAKNFWSVVESFEELESEVAVVLLEKKPNLCKKGKINLSLLSMVVRNALIDKFFRSKKLNELAFSEFEEEGSSFDAVDKRELPPLSIINVNEAVRKVKETLSESEIETLCYYLYSVLYRKEENPFLKEKSKDAKYKAWSRLKPKISEILSPFDFSEEEMKLFARNFLSEFLRKTRSN